MSAVVEIPERLEKATAQQRDRTVKALERGAPVHAAPHEQRELRAAYIAEHWDSNIVPEGNIGSNDTLWSSFLTMGARCARAVVRVVWKDRPAQSNWQGTAFLISDWVVLTNHHVLESADAAKIAALEFDYEFDDEGRERRGRRVHLDPERLFMSVHREGELDYAVVALAAGRSGAAPGKGRSLPLIAERGKAQNGDPLNLIHHPAGARKRITVRDSRLLGVDDFTLQYSGDTLGGSSGAPVFNDQWEVVGLHFGGKPKRDAQKRRLLVDGTPWDPSIPEDKIDYEFNVGVRVSSLVRDMRKRAADLAAEPRQLLFNAIGENR